MKALRTLSRLTASTLLVTAAACADNITQGHRQPDPAAGTSEPPANSSTASATPPTLDIKSTSGTSSQFLNGPATAPPGAYYRVDVKGAGFPVGSGWQARVVSVFLDGQILALAAGTGVNPADGSFRIAYITNCPSRVREVYAVVVSGGRTTESKHIAPAC
jgi:hypothetical protein